MMNISSIVFSQRSLVCRQLSACAVSSAVLYFYKRMGSIVEDYLPRSWNYQACQRFHYFAPFLLVECLALIKKVAWVVNLTALVFLGIVRYVFRGTPFPSEESLPIGDNLFAKEKRELRDLLVQAREKVESSYPHGHDKLSAFLDCIKLETKLHPHKLNPLECEAKWMIRRYFKRDCPSNKKVEIVRKLLDLESEILRQEAKNIAKGDPRALVEIANRVVEFDKQEAVCLLQKVKHIVREIPSDYLKGNIFSKIINIEMKVNPQNLMSLLEKTKEQVRKIDRYPPKVLAFLEMAKVVFQFNRDEARKLLQEGEQFIQVTGHRGSGPIIATELLWEFMQVVVEFDPVQRYRLLEKAGKIGSKYMSMRNVDWLVVVLKFLKVQLDLNKELFTRKAFNMVDYDNYIKRLKKYLSSIKKANRKISGHFPKIVEVELKMIEIEIKISGKEKAKLELKRVEEIVNDREVKVFNYRIFKLYRWEEVFNSRLAIARKKMEIDQKEGRNDLKKIKKGIIKWQRFPTLQSILLLKMMEKEDVIEARKTLQGCALPTYKMHLILYEKLLNQVNAHLAAKEIAPDHRSTEPFFGIIHAFLGK